MRNINIPEQKKGERLASGQVRTEDMTPTRALTLAILLLDFELESQPPGPPSTWVREVMQARHVLAELKSSH